MAAWELKNVPTESPASRHNRDNIQKRGDWQTVNVGANGNNLNVSGKLVYNATSRYAREFDFRGGEVSYRENGTRFVEVDGRNSRIYVSPTTKLSAENGLQSRIWTSPASAR